MLTIVVFTFRIGVAFTSSNGDTMEIKSLGTLERYVEPCASLNLKSVFLSSVEKKRLRR